jgi:hypothetical protein
MPSHFSALALFDRVVTRANNRIDELLPHLRLTVLTFYAHPSRWRGPTFG